MCKSRENNSAGDSTTTTTVSTVHWLIKPLPPTRPTVFLSLSLQNTAELPALNLFLNLVRQVGDDHLTGS